MPCPRVLERLWPARGSGFPELRFVQLNTQVGRGGPWALLQEQAGQACGTPHPLGLRPGATLRCGLQGEAGDHGVGSPAPRVAGGAFHTSEKQPEESGPFRVWFSRPLLSLRVSFPILIFIYYFKAPLRLKLNRLLCQNPRSFSWILFSFF